MPNFDAEFTSGTTIGVWSDPALGAIPTRINPAPGHPHRRHNGTLSSQVEITATVGGVLGEVDANLGGELFIGDIAESPVLPHPNVTSPAGQSSVQRFTPEVAGHYTFILRRENGGGFYLHVDVT